MYSKWISALSALAILLVAACGSPSDDGGSATTIADDPMIGRTAPPAGGDDTTAYLVTALSVPAEGEFGGVEFDWDGVEETVCPTCDAVLSEYDAASAATIEFSLDNLRFGDVLLPAACT